MHVRPVSVRNGSSLSVRFVSVLVRPVSVRTVGLRPGTARLCPVSVRIRSVSVLVGPLLSVSFRVRPVSVYGPYPFVSVSVSVSVCQSAVSQTRVVQSVCDHCLSAAAGGARASSGCACEARVTSHRPVQREEEREGEGEGGRGESEGASWEVAGPDIPVAEAPPSVPTEPSSHYRPGQ